jgi:hypothetical protein
MFKLSEGRATRRGIYCGDEGLYLGPVALIEREGNGYHARPAAEIEALLAAAYETPPDLSRCLTALPRLAANLEANNLSLAQIGALQLHLADIADDRIEQLIRTDDTLKANFNPNQPRDEQGRWTDEGHEGHAGNIRPATARARSHGNRAWEDFPNPDFRNRLAVAERTAETPHFGYREVLDRTDSTGHRYIALGRYQMTPAGLQAAGLIDKNGTWTGKYGVHSRAQFLTDPEAQEKALSDFLGATERQLRAAGAFDHVGQSIEGLRDSFTITRAGLIAAGHREGATATSEYLRKVAANGFSSKGLDLNDTQRAIETHLRTFADASYH